MQCPTGLLGRSQRRALVKFMEIWDNCRPQDIGRLIRMVALRCSTHMGQAWCTDDTAKVEMICTVARAAKTVSEALPLVDCLAQRVNVAYTECLTERFSHGRLWGVLRRRGAGNLRHELTSSIY